MKFDLIPMAEVPAPPMKFASRKYAELYAALEKLPKGDTHALKLQVSGQKELKSIRAAALKNMKRRGRRVLSSRNAAYTELYLWLEDRQETRKK